MKPPARRTAGEQQVHGGKGGFAKKRKMDHSSRPAGAQTLPSGHNLIVVPLGILKQWEAEIPRCVPDTHVAVVWPPGDHDGAMQGVNPCEVHILRGPQRLGQHPKALARA